jgi:hypothetical protein
LSRALFIISLQNSSLKLRWPKIPWKKLPPYKVWVWIEVSTWLKISPSGDLAFDISLISTLWPMCSMTYVPSVWIFEKKIMFFFSLQIRYFNPKSRDFYFHGVTPGTIPDLTKNSNILVKKTRTSTFFDLQLP